MTPKRRYLFLLGRPVQQQIRRRQLQVQAVAFQPALPLVWTLLAYLRRYGMGDRQFPDLNIMLSHMTGYAQPGTFAGWATRPL